MLYVKMVIINLLHVNKVTYMKDNYFHIKIMQKCHCFKFLQNSYILFSFIEDSWILIPVFVFRLLKYTVLVVIYEENSASYKYIIGKGRIYLFIF